MEKKGLMACAERAAVAPDVHNLLWHSTGKLAAAAFIHFYIYSS
jgi:hypothetical protein